MEVQRVEVRSSKQDTETILAVFYSFKDRPGVPIESTELLRRIGLEVKDKHYGKCVNRARRFFEQQTSIHLRTLWGVGYCVPEGDEQVRDGVLGLRRAEGVYDRSERIIAEVTQDRLSDRGRELQSRMLAKMRLVHELVRTKTLPLLAEVQAVEALPRMAITA